MIREDLPFESIVKMEYADHVNVTRCGIYGPLFLSLVLFFFHQCSTENGILHQPFTICDSRHCPRGSLLPVPLLEPSLARRCMNNATGGRELTSPCARLLILALTWQDLIHCFNQVWADAAMLFCFSSRCCAQLRS